MAKEVRFFDKQSPYFELSNFYIHTFTVNEVMWPSMEHYFQAMKFVDKEYQELIRQSPSPQKAKQLGQSRKFKIHDTWDDIREKIMYDGLQEKFKDITLKSLLLQIGKKKLIENSPYDSYWGIGSRGKGKNKLGELLMTLRAEL